MTDLHVGDCLPVLKCMDAESVHMVLTDPPYFLDGLNDKWRKGHGDNDWVKRRRTDRRKHGGDLASSTMPTHMKFDVKQSKALQNFLSPVAKQLHRVMKPGAFALMFSAPRLAHRAAIALEDVGFEIRDIYAWRFYAKALYKAFSLDHVVRGRDDLNDMEKASIIKRLRSRRIAQLRPNYEPIICAQKPREGTFVDNWLEHEVGLIDASQRLNGNVPSTVMEVEKPINEKWNTHPTTKPVKLCEHLIKLFSLPGQTVLDPFLGSGTTAVAAEKSGRTCMGIEINQEYADIAKRRLGAVDFERQPATETQVALL